MGMTLGLALEGYIPVSCFPRFDFLILALNQLVNHIDKIDYLTDNQFKSKIIIGKYGKPAIFGKKFKKNQKELYKKFSL